MLVFPFASHEMLDLLVSSPDSLNWWEEGEGEEEERGRREGREGVCECGGLLGSQQASNKNPCFHLNKHFLSLLELDYFKAPIKAFQQEPKASHI